MENNTIFTITKVLFDSVLNPNNVSECKNLKSNTLGYYFSKEACENLIHNSGNDLVESQWDFIVVEEVCEGGRGMKEIDWYQWSDEKWVKVQKPKELQYVYCFSMGG
jgi:hypothetical protein